MKSYNRDSYRIELFTQSKEAQLLRRWLKDHNANSDPGYLLSREHARFGGSIFLIVAPACFREWFFENFGAEKWFAMEGSIVRNVDTWEIEAE